MGRSTTPRAGSITTAILTGPDGCSEQLDGCADTYLEYASEYFERQLPADAVTAVFEHRPITAELVRALNPERVLDDLVDDLIRLDLNEIGYPAR